MEILKRHPKHSVLESAALLVYPGDFSRTFLAPGLFRPYALQLIVGIDEIYGLMGSWVNKVCRKESLLRASGLRFSHWCWPSPT
jgi:hypothetical protein